MKCDECNKETDRTVTDMWNCRVGQVIGKDEHLCVGCANKRDGYFTLADINNKRYGEKVRKG